MLVVYFRDQCVRLRIQVKMKQGEWMSHRLGLPKFMFGKASGRGKKNS